MLEVRSDKLIVTPEAETKISLHLTQTDMIGQPERKSRAEADRGIIAGDPRGVVLLGLNYKS
jgi:hypothetical protein